MIGMDVRGRGKVVHVRDCMGGVGHVRDMMDGGGRGCSRTCATIGWAG